MAVAGHYAARDGRRQAERANILCGYTAVAKEQLCPLHFLFCLFSETNQSSFTHTVSVFSDVSYVLTLCTTVTHYH